MAVYDITWATVAANGQWSCFVHGFTDKEAVTFSIVAFAGSGPGVLYPVGHATLTQGESMEHVDGTKAYKVYVQNNAPFSTTDVHLLAQVESL